MTERPDAASVMPFARMLGVQCLRVDRDEVVVRLAADR
jgi:acyl-coenzyme A thioesterase PaaI-like protein